jgi:DNA-binding PadR family transcriptional regulator
MAGPSKRLEEKLTKENLWLYILSLLSKKDMYGYELRGAISDTFGFRPGNVTAYRVLYALKRGGFVRIITKRVGGRERKYYQITEKGSAEIARGKSVLKTISSKL